MPDEYPSIKPVQVTPVTPVESKSEVKSEGPKEYTPDAVEKPIELGYISELLNLGESANHFKMPKLTSEIDEFVLSEIKRQDLKSNRDSYKEIIDGFLKTLNLPDGVDNYTKVEKLVDLIRINKKLVEAMLEKDALLKGDPSEMTSAQLKKYIKEKEWLKA